MSGKTHKRMLEKREAEEAGREKKFFDACALGLVCCHKEIESMRGHGFVAVTSFLALGEAIGNEINKDKDPGKLPARGLFDFIVMQINDGTLTLVSAEGVNSAFDSIRGYFSEKEITDIHHVACAISNGCEALVSSDSDICGLSKSTKDELQNIFNLRIEPRAFPEDKREK